MIKDLLEWAQLEQPWPRWKMAVGYICMIDVIVREFAPIFKL
jgi:hypothetical protein